METIKDILFVVGGIVGLATGLIALWAQFSEKRKRAEQAERRAQRPRPAARPRSRYPEAIPVEEVPEVIPIEPVDEEEYDDRPRLTPKQRTRAKETVKAPALAVMIAGGLGLLANPLMIMGGFIAAGEKGGAEPSDVVMMLMFAACTVASGLAIWAGYNMLYLRNYGLSMAGSFAIMPGACICLLSGLGIGIWAVIVLLKPDVKEAFR